MAQSDAMAAETAAMRAFEAAVGKAEDLGAGAHGRVLEWAAARIGEAREQHGLLTRTEGYGGGGGGLRAVGGGGAGDSGVVTGAGGAGGATHFTVGGGGAGHGD
jgi:hypothetical protein